MLLHWLPLRVQCPVGAFGRFCCGWGVSCMWLNPGARERCQSQAAEAVPADTSAGRASDGHSRGSSVYGLQAHGQAACGCVFTTTCGMPLWAGATWIGRPGVGDDVVVVVQQAVALERTKQLMRHRAVDLLHIKKSCWLYEEAAICFLHLLSLEPRNQPASNTLRAWDAKLRGHQEVRES